MLLLLAFSLLFGGSALAASPLDETVEDLLGIRYKYGGTNESGFDCSGFTSYVFAALGIELPRDSRSQAKLGVKIAKHELKKGDLVFFNTNGKTISHVGIYIGDGKMAHASTKQGTVITEIDSGYYAKRYVTARRILSDDQYVALATEVAPDVGQTEEKTIDIQAPVTAID